MDCSPPDFLVHHQLLESTQTRVEWVGDAIQSSHPLLSPSPALHLSKHQCLFKWVSSSHQVSQVLELQHQSPQWIFKTDFLEHWLVWFDLLAVQGTLKSLLQRHSSKASVLWCSAFLMVQLSHLYVSTGKTIALTRWTFVSQVMSLLFNMLSVYVGHSFSSKEQVSFNFMAAVTICSDFGVQENTFSEFLMKI